MLTQMDIFSRMESNVRTYCRHFPAVFGSAQGCWMTTNDGRRYLDLLCGAGSLNYGHNNPVIMDRVSEYIRNGGVVHSLDLHTVAKADFLQVFNDTILAPRHLDYKVQFPGPTGTNAVEAALKLARKVTGRSGIAAFVGGYHGMTLGSLAATTSPTARAAAGVPLDHVSFLPYQGDPGAIWIRRLADLCKELGMLMIVDDIQAGCGRTGTFFSFEELGIVPDIVLLSKSLSGFGAPFSIVLMRPELDVWQPGEHNGTFRGNNLAFVGATAAIQHYWSDSAFSAGIQVRSDLIQDCLSKVANSLPAGAAKIKGRGLLIGIKFNDPTIATAVSERAFEHGLIVETCGRYHHVLKLLPPLNISLEDLQLALDIITEAILETASSRLKLAS
jgi:diaminobutyrate-2-oxoglutarate transaminase